MANIWRRHSLNYQKWKIYALEEESVENQKQLLFLWIVVFLHVYPVVRLLMCACVLVCARRETIGLRVGERTSLITWNFVATVCVSQAKILDCINLRSGFRDGLSTKEAKDWGSRPVHNDSSWMVSECNDSLFFFKNSPVS